MYVCMHVCMYVCIYVDFYIYINIYIYIYVQTNMRQSEGLATECASHYHLDEDGIWKNGN